MPTVFLLLTLISAATYGGASCVNRQQRRRLLHQPFFPVVNSVPPTAQPPSPAPSPERAHHDHQAQVPKYPFSTTPPSNPQRPFFPSYQAPPPPPPPPSILSTIPANISSLLLPHRSSSSAHRHVVLLSVSLSLLFAAVLAAILALFLYLRHRRRHGSSDKVSSSRADSQRLFPPNLPPSDGPHKSAGAGAVHLNLSSLNNPPPLSTTNTSSEFLYLGTLVNSRSTSQEFPLNTTNAGLKIGVSMSPTAYRKLGSPELKPLPPLPKYNSSFTSGEMCFSKEETKFETTGDSEEDEDEEEEFFSPRGSSGRKETPSPGLDPGPTRIGSSSRRENFGSRSFNSRTASYPYSNSNSPSNSITSDSCHSPVRNLSPKSVSSSRTDSLNSPDRVSNLSGHSRQSPLRTAGDSKPFVFGKLPPPPPPPPPPRFWEAPRAAMPSSGLPVLVAPSRPVVVQNMEPPGFGPEQLVKNESVETTPKPKLKPLHWDKVRASSDRAMVWDQLKSSSFQ